MSPSFFLFLFYPSRRTRVSAGQRSRRRNYWQLRHVVTDFFLFFFVLIVFPFFRFSENVRIAILIKKLNKVTTVMRSAPDTNVWGQCAVKSLRTLSLYFELHYRGFQFSEKGKSRRNRAEKKKRRRLERPLGACGSVSVTQVVWVPFRPSTVVGNR